MTAFAVSTDISATGTSDAVVGARAPVSRKGYTGAARVAKSPARGALGYFVAGFNNPTGKGPSKVSRKGCTEDEEGLTPGNWLRDLGGLSVFKPPSQYLSFLLFLPFFP